VNRIDRTFQELRPRGRLALIAYLTAGYPSLQDTPSLVEAVASAGADMVELGFPFSDPLADGPTIQAASQAALKQGVTVARALEAAASARRRTAVPLLVMTYLNPVLAFGVEAFCRRAAQAGLDLVFFVAPTSTPARIRAAAAAATGFIYCVALTGVTGARDQLDPAVLPLVRSVKAETSLPVVVGFGLSRPEHLQALRGVADGAIVASALLDAIRQEPQDAVGAASRFVRGLEVR
jgi:tryptophan synthase alpha chain